LLPEALFSMIYLVVCKRHDLTETDTMAGGRPLTLMDGISKPGYRRLGVLLFLPLLLQACVSSGTHKRTEAQLASSRAREVEIQEELTEELRRRDDREAQLNNRIRELEAEIEAYIEEVGMARRETLRTREQLSETETEVQRLRSMLSARGAEAQELQDRLDQLSAIEEEVRETNRIYEDVTRRFRSQIESGRLSVAITQGRMVINLPQDILFASGSATLGRDGRRTVSEVAEVLSSILGRRFQVEGHTDDDAISTAEFPSNWELSSARALSVVKLLVESGVAPQALSGAAYGEFDPVADNESQEGKRLNRRIEIVMLSNLDVMTDADSGG
jgi:chemotaxis protein MotB